MRIVGKAKVASSDKDRWIAGIRASDLAKSLGIPSFRKGGVFRGPQEMFDRMDAERLMQRQRWLDEHSLLKAKAMSGNNP
jgi:hypothetical protein